MDLEAKKTALRMLVHGIYIVAAGQGEEAVANGVTWLTQASFEPPLIMVAIRVDGRLHDAIQRTSALAVNILASDQRNMAQSFFKPAETRGNTINGYEFTPGPVTGSPILTDAHAWFEAEVRHSFHGGDHTVFIAQVVEAGVRDPDIKPLALHDTPWQYGG
ncbi:MAG TPA: flavin reductase [Anaerolineae bacterium]|nr:flavin reductase [Anaerolineae bacterium]